MSLCCLISVLSLCCDLCGNSVCDSCIVQSILGLKVSLVCLNLVCRKLWLKFVLCVMNSFLLSCLNNVGVSDVNVGVLCIIVLEMFVSCWMNGGIVCFGLMRFVYVDMLSGLILIMLILVMWWLVDELLVVLRLMKMSGCLLVGLDGWELDMKRLGNDVFVSMYWWVYLWLV